MTTESTVNPFADEQLVQEYARVIQSQHFSTENAITATNWIADPIMRARVQDEIVRLSLTKRLERRQFNWRNLFSRTSN